LSADIPLGRKIGMVDLDAIEQARAQHIELRDVTGRFLLVTDDAAKPRGPHSLRTGWRVRGSIAIARYVRRRINGIRRERLFGHLRLLVDADHQSDISPAAAQFATKYRVRFPRSCR